MEPTVALTSSTVADVELDDLLSDLSAVEVSEKDTILEEIEAENAELHALDATLDAIEEIEAAPAAPAEVVLDDLALDGAMDSSLEEALALDLEKVEAYETQTSEVTIGETEIVAAPSPAEPSVAATKVVKARTASTKAAPIVRDLAAIPAEFFVTDVTVTADPEGQKARLIAKRPSQVKIAEKFDNLFQSLASGRAPSVYVVEAFKLLDKSDTVTTTELVNAFKLFGWSEGTARSQVGQIAALFPVLGIATRSGSTLTLNENSKIADRLRALGA